MRDYAIRKIIEDLTHHNIDLKNLSVLDFFAREGDWQTKVIADKVKVIHAWEVNPEFEENLKKNLPNAKIKIGDSFSFCKNSDERFDLIILDNPQGCFGINQDKCEHFDALPEILNLLNNQSIVIFNVKTEPFDYHKHEKWQSRRNDFYQRQDCSNLDKEFSFNFYKNYFETLGFKVDYMNWHIRPQETGLYEMVAVLLKCEK